MTLPVSGHVVLVGPMASGKSAVGEILARRLGLSLVDLDQLVSEQHGPIPEFFAQHGEAAFRAAESAALIRALDGPPSVIATGGGVVLAAANREALAPHTVIKLHITAATAAKRLTGDTTRPLLAGDDPVAAWSAIAAAREPLYSEVATHAVAADAEGAEAIATAIATVLTKSFTQEEKA